MSASSNSSHARPRSTRPIAAAAAVVAIVLAGVGFTAVHGLLERSEPADGERLATAPDTLRLTYNEPVEPAVTRIRLIGPSGTAVVLGEPGLAAGAPNVVIVGIHGPLEAGRHTVEWRTTGADGHPVRGSFTFAIDSGAAGLAGAEPADTAHPDTTVAAGPVGGSAASSGGAFDAASPGFAGVRWLTFAALLGLIGVATFRLIVLPLAARRRMIASAEYLPRAADGAVRAGYVLGLVLLVAVALRFVAQSYAVYGAVGGTRAAELLSTSWGLGWMIQAAGALIALLALRLTRAHAAGGWSLFGATALLLAFTPALSGHTIAVPGNAPVAIAVDGIHVLGAGGWLGGLLMVVVAGIGAAFRLEEGQRGAAAATLVAAFSPTALVFAGLVVASGVYAAWLHLGTLPALWESTYGRMLILKLSVLALSFVVGAYNFLRLKPSLADESDARRIRRSSTVELAVGVIVLAVTAVLVALPTP